MENGQKKYGPLHDTDTVNALCTLFRDLNYELPPPYINKTEAKMRKAIYEYATHDYTSYGCLIIFIMSHGDKSKIISSDSEIIDLNEFITPLKRNDSLKSKPSVSWQQCNECGQRQWDNKLIEYLSKRVY